MENNHSKRFCSVCKKNTTWQWIKSTGHSSCFKCGNKYAGEHTVERIITGEKSPIPFKKYWQFGYNKKPETNNEVQK